MKYFRGSLISASVNLHIVGKLSRYQFGAVSIIADVFEIILVINYQDLIDDKSLTRLRR